MTPGILFGILHTVSVGFAVLSLWRLYEYIKRYRFDESKYTLLLGFVHLRYISVVYFAFVILWVLVSFFFVAAF